MRQLARLLPIVIFALTLAVACGGDKKAGTTPSTGDSRTPGDSAGGGDSPTGDSTTGDASGGDAVTFLGAGDPCDALDDRCDPSTLVCADIDGDGNATCSAACDFVSRQGCSTTELCVDIILYDPAGDPTAAVCVAALASGAACDADNDLCDPGAGLVCAGGSLLGDICRTACDVATNLPCNTGGGEDCVPVDDGEPDAGFCLAVGGCGGSDFWDGSGCAVGDTCVPIFIDDGINPLAILGTCVAAGLQMEGGSCDQSATASSCDATLVCGDQLLSATSCFQMCQPPGGALDCDAPTTPTTDVCVDLACVAVGLPAGEVAIEVDYECSPALQDCGAGFTCEPVLTMFGWGNCVATVGTVGVGESCTSDGTLPDELCTDGLLCIEFGDGNEEQCIEPCDPSQSWTCQLASDPPSRTCIDVGALGGQFPPDVFGLCAPLCDTGGEPCPAGEACLSYDPAGGIGICGPECRPGGLNANTCANMPEYGGDAACAPKDLRYFVGGTGVCDAGIPGGATLCDNDGDCTGGGSQSCIFEDGSFSPLGANLSTAGFCAFDCNPFSIGSCRGAGMPPDMTCVRVDGGAVNEGFCVPMAAGGQSAVECAPTQDDPWGSYQCYGRVGWPATCVLLHDGGGDGPRGQCVRGCYAGDQGSCDGQPSTCQAVPFGASDGICLAGDGCDVFAQSGCEPFETCQAGGGGPINGLTTECTPIGIQGRNEPCDRGEDSPRACEPGLGCIDPGIGAQICTPYCNPQNDDADCGQSGTCRDIGGRFYLSPGNLGACVESCSPSTGGCDAEVACYPDDIEAWLHGNGWCRDDELAGFDCTVDADCDATETCALSEISPDGGTTMLGRCFPTCTYPGAPLPSIDCGGQTCFPDPGGSAGEGICMPAEGGCDPNALMDFSCVFATFAWPSRCAPTGDGRLGGFCVNSCWGQDPFSCGGAGSCVPSDDLDAGFCIAGDDCDPVAQTGCGPDATCSVQAGGAIGGRRDVCSPAEGNRQGGEPCRENANDCAAGLVCAGLHGDASGDQCTSYCDPAASGVCSGANAACTDISDSLYLTPGDIGLCDTQCPLDAPCADGRACWPADDAPFASRGNGLCHGDPSITLVLDCADQGDCTTGQTCLFDAVSGRGRCLDGCADPSECTGLGNDCWSVPTASNSAGADGVCMSDFGLPIEVCDPANLQDTGCNNQVQGDPVACLPIAGANTGDAQGFCTRGCFLDMIQDPGDCDGFSGTAVCNVRPDAVGFCHADAGCDPIAQSGCPADTTCLVLANLAAGGIATECVPARGTDTEGDTCTEVLQTGSCEPGLYCAPTGVATGECRRYCDSLTGGCSACIDLSPFLGEPTGTVGRCDP